MALRLVIRPLDSIQVTAAEQGIDVEFAYRVHGEDAEGRSFGSVVSIDGDTNRAWRAAEALWVNARHPITRVAIYEEPHRSRFVQFIKRPATSALVGWVDDGGAHHPEPNG